MPLWKKTRSDRAIVQVDKQDEELEASPELTDARFSKSRLDRDDGAEKRRENG